MGLDGAPEVQRREAAEAAAAGRRQAGRPPLFGRAGNYERVYAEVRPQVARRIRADALRRGVSASRLLCEIINAAKGDMAAAGPPPKDGGTERLYAQVESGAARRLRRAAAARGWGVARLLGLIVDEHYRRIAG